MISKVNITSIIIGHYNTLVCYRTKKPMYGDYFLFLGVPLILSIISFYFNLKINVNSAAVITTAVTILAGLLFNLLVLLYSVACNRKKPYTNREDTSNFFLEINSNISYSIFISLLSLIPLIYLSIFQDENSAAINILSNIVIFIIIHLLLTLVMILKRIHVLFSTEFKFLF